MEGMGICGQCGEVTEDNQNPCPADRCNLALCPTCSDPSVHFNPDGSCAEGLTKEEIQKRLRETGLLE